MRERALSSNRTYAETFPGLMHPVRKNAANDNRPSLLKTVCKHVAVVLGVFAGLFLIKSI